MRNKGFTLIELLIVVAIIGIIAAIAIPNLLIALQKGRQKATIGDLKSTGTAIEAYNTDWAFVPRATFGELLSASYFSPFYIRVLPREDSWGTIFDYAYTDDLYTIRSWGRDKSPTDPPTPALYDVTKLLDFNNDIFFSNGQFTVGPRVKR